jgi:serine/threonine protein kinase
VPQIQICPQGHRWDPTRDARDDAELRWNVCPECGQGVELFSLRDTNPSGTTPGTSPASNPEVPLQAPEPSLPNYQILNLLGYGGMGVVYKARQIDPDRVVALKLIAAGPRARPSDLARFRTENQAISRVAHPHIVRVWEVGEYQGLPYAALEFMDRGNLREAIANNPLPARCAAEVVELVARAMQTAHEAGIIHRDLKPANILLSTPEDGHPLSTWATVRLLGVPKVSDFGLAKQIDGEGANTRTGAVMGTPSYMAPEQAEGRTKYVGPATDIYSLGAILYECLTGRPPFHGETVLETLDQVRYNEPVPPTRLRPPTFGSVPRELEIICLKCLAKDPRERYRTAGELADDLRRYLDGKPIHARAPSYLWRVVRQTVRQPLALALALSSVALFVVLGLLVQKLLAVFTPRPVVPPPYETVYYAAVGRKWGILDGIHRLTEAEAQRRQRSFRFTLREGLVEKVEAVDWRGRPTTNHNVRTYLDLLPAFSADRLNPGGGPGPFSIGPLAALFELPRAGPAEQLVCTWEFQRDEQGNLKVERARDVASRVVWTFQIARFSLAGADQSIKESATGFYADERGYPRARTSSGASHVELTFASDGHVQEARYRSAGGRPRPDRDGIFGRRYIRDPRGLIHTESFLGAEDQPMLHPWGFARVGRVWDTEGNQLETTYYDLTGHPALLFGAAHKSLTSYDADGNPIRRENLGKDDKVATSVRMKYDSRGHLLTEENLDAAGKVVVRGGFGRRDFGYDKEGNCIRVASFDAAGLPIRIRPLGCEVVAPGYDKQGRMIEIKFLDASDKPAPPVRENPPPGGTGGPGRRLRGEEVSLQFEYNDRGQIIERRALGADDKTPVIDGWGAARTTFVYNGDGLMTEEAFFGPDGKPTRGNLRYARRVLEYEKGNFVGITFYDTDGQLLFVENQPGTDGLLELVLATRFPEESRPLAGRLVLKRDDEGGNIIEARLSGRNGVWTADGSGVAEVRCKYDQFGALSDLTTFGVDRRPIARPDGVARITWTVDELGNVTEVATFGEGGNPIVPRVLARVERPEGTPAPATGIRVTGVARHARKFDGYKLVEENFFGADNLPTTGNLGYARTVFRYRADGHPDSSTYYDDAGNEVRTRPVIHQRTWLFPNAPNPDLLPRDVLLTYDGKEIHCAWEFVERKEREHQGETKMLSLRRQGEELELPIPSGPVPRPAGGPFAGLGRERTLLLLLTPGNLQADPRFGTWGEENLP